MLVGTSSTIFGRSIPLGTTYTYYLGYWHTCDKYTSETAGSDVLQQHGVIYATWDETFLRRGSTYATVVPE